MAENKEKESSIPTYYVNAANISINPYDIVLELGIRETLPKFKQESEIPENPPVKPLVNIVMSPQHALVLNKLLKKMLHLYEVKVGKINVPKSILANLGLETEEEEDD